MKGRLYENIMFELTGSEIRHLRKTIQDLSDQQFQYLTFYMRRLGSRFMTHGIFILPGRHAWLQASVSPRDLGIPAANEQQKMEFGPATDSPECSMLRQRVQALPLELLFVIEQYTFDHAFLGAIHLHQKAGTTVAKKCIEHYVNLKAVGLLDQRTRLQYADRVFTENM